MVVDSYPGWSGWRREPRSQGFVHSLDLLPGAGRSGHIHAAPAAVLVVLAVPDQAMSSFEREDEGYRGPSGRDQAWRRASGPELMEAIETAKMDFRMMFWNLRLSVNYYYPPDCSFESSKREKAFA